MYKDNGFASYFKQKAIKCRKLDYAFSENTLTRGYMKRIFTGKPTIVTFDEDNFVFTKLQTETNEENKEISVAKLNLSQVTGFTFGGFGSTFWLLKDYINKKCLHNGEQLPPEMLCWNMISLQVGQQKTERTYDLILSNDSDMDLILLFLLKNKFGCDSLKNCEHEAGICLWASLTSYRMMRIRMKISYSSWLKRLPIIEMILTEIVSTYEKLNLRMDQRPMNMQILLDNQPFKRCLQILFKNAELDQAIKTGDYEKATKIRKFLAQREEMRFDREKVHQSIKLIENQRLIV